MIIFSYYEIKFRNNYCYLFVTCPEAANNKLENRPIQGGVGLDNNDQNG